MTDMTDRQQYIDGLRELADLLDKHDDLPLPTHGDIRWLLFGADRDNEKQKALAAVIVRRITGGVFDKQDLGHLFQFRTHLGGQGGLEIGVTVDRDAVCERVVTGTREVTEMVPDPTINVRLVEVTKTVEDVEWRCGSLLDDAEESS